MKSRLVRRTAALLLLGSFLGGCRGPAYYEKENLAQPIMNLSDDPTELHWMQKVLYSNEGAVGGIGSAAGGGCGCY